MPKTISNQVKVMEMGQKQCTVRKCKNGYVVSKGYGDEEICKNMKECAKCMEAYMGDKDEGGEEKEDE